jgi:hypothetical protein
MRTYSRHPCCLFSVFHFFLDHQCRYKNEMAKERILIRFLKEECSFFTEHIWFAQEENCQSLHIYHHKMIIWTFLKGKFVCVFTHIYIYTHNEQSKVLSLQGRLLLGLAWRKRPSRWGYIPSHNLSVIWSEIRNAFHLLLSSARAAGLNVNGQIPDLGIDVLS